MRSTNEIKEDILALEKEIQALKAKKQQEKLEKLLANVATNTAVLSRELNSKAYVDFMVSKSYVDALRAEIEEAKTDAVNIVSGISTPVKVNKDSLETFGNLTAGEVLKIQGNEYLVTDFAHSYAGSTASLLPLTTKMQISGRPVTPYSATSCNFNHQNKCLTVSNFNRLSQGQTLTISGVLYEPVAFIGNQKFFAKYELQEVVSQ